MDEKIWCYKRFTSDLKTHTESEEMEKDSSCKWNEKKAGKAILTLDKIDL